MGALNRTQALCPFCTSEQDVPWDGSFRPRYHICRKCWRRFVYEPTRQGIETFDPRRVKNCSNPDYRDMELGEDDF